MLPALTGPFAHLEGWDHNGFPRQGVVIRPSPLPSAPHNARRHLLVVGGLRQTPHVQSHPEEDGGPVSRICQSIKKLQRLTALSHSNYVSVGVLLCRKPITLGTNLSGCTAFDCIYAAYRSVLLLLCASCTCCRSRIERDGGAREAERGASRDLERVGGSSGGAVRLRGGGKSGGYSR